MFKPEEVHGLRELHEKYPNQIIQVGLQRRYSSYYAAAKKLGVDGPGTANVEIRTVGSGQALPTSAVRAIPLSKELKPDIPLFVQMGSFSSHVNASNLVKSLLDANESTAQISRLQTDSGLYYRVWVGPMFDIDEANAIVSRLKSKGFQTARIVVQDNAE